MRKTTFLWTFRGFYGILLIAVIFYERRRLVKKQSKKSCFSYIDFWIMAAASLCLGSFVLHEVSVRADNFPITRALLLAVICLLFYIGGYLFSVRTGSKRILKSLFFLFFLLYLYLLLSLTLLDASMGRGENSVYNSIAQTRHAYNARFVNFVPFRSIYHVYIKGFFRGYVNAYYTLLNLIGNILAFMPLAFFLPYFFPSQAKWYLFLPTALLSVTLIESLQFSFMIGSCDVDDLILNAGGSFLFFLILKIPFVNRLILKLT